MDPLEQEIAAAVQAEAAKLPTDPTAPKGINVKLGENTLAFTDEADLNSRLGNYFTQQHNELATTKAELERQRSEFEAFRQSQPQQVARPAEGSTVNEKDEFLRNFATAFVDDPVKGFEMAFERSKYATEHKQLAETTQAVKNAQVGKAFTDSHPDYYATNENGTALVQIMKHYNLPFNENSLHLAYVEGLRGGMIKPNDAADTQSMNFAPQSRRAMPTVGRTTETASPEFLNDVERMSAEQIAAVIHRLENKA